MLAYGRCLALSAYHYVQLYPRKRHIPLNSEHGGQALVLIHMLKEMARAKTMAKTKDKHLFSQVRALLKPCRQAMVISGETPLGAIAQQYSKMACNKVVGGLLDSKMDYTLDRMRWKTDYSTESFITVIWALIERYDGPIQLYINTEIPYSVHDKVPAFVLLTGEFATEGACFGVIYNRNIIVIPPATPYPIAECIILWLNILNDVSPSETSDMFRDAIMFPDAVMPTNKFHKFLRGIDPGIVNGGADNQTKRSM